MPDKLKCRYFPISCIVDTQGRTSNLDSTLARGLAVCKREAKRDGPLAIVASGPSVSGYLDELREWHGEIWAINGAYDYLLGKGIIPHGFISIDPLPGLAQYIQHPHEDTTFYIASICDPAVFDALDGYKVKLWHPASDDTQYPKGDIVIIGGTTTATRAPYLALLLGWREIVLFGVEGSYASEEKGSEYCYPWGTFALDIDQPKHRVRCTPDGEAFVTELGLLRQVSQLAVMHARFRGMLRFKCGGLMQAFLDAPYADDSMIEVEEDEAA